MSSEMREEVVSLRRLAEVIRKYGTCAPAALETVANNIERLLARTEAGADGADMIQWRYTNAETGEVLTPWTECDAAFREKRKDAPGYQFRELFAHPQDASGDAAKLSEVERKAVTDLMESQVYEAGDVDDEPPRIDEDEDAYWAYHNYHGLRKLLAMQAKEAK